MLLLNVALFTVAGLLGARFLLQTLHRLTIAPSELFSDVLDEEGHSAEFANLPELSLPVCWSRSRRRAGAPLLALRLNSAHRRALWCYTRVASVKPNSSVHNLDLIELSAKSLGGP